MGFSQEQAESAIKRFGSVQQALDSLLAGVGKDLRLRCHGNNKSIKGTRVRVTNTNTPCYCFTIVFCCLWLCGSITLILCLRDCISFHDKQKLAH